VKSTSRLSQKGDT